MIRNREKENKIKREKKEMKIKNILNRINGFGEERQIDGSFSILFPLNASIFRVFCIDSNWIERIW